MPQTTLTVIMSAEDLLKIPYDGCCYLIDHAAANCQLAPSFIRALYDAECAGKARWPVMNKLRLLLANPPQIACAKCDRGDGQLGHAEECPKA